LFDSRGNHDACHFKGLSVKLLTRPACSRTILVSDVEFDSLARRDVDELNILQTNSFHRNRRPTGQLVDATSPNVGRLHVEPGLVDRLGLTRIRPSICGKALLSWVGEATDTWEGK
jgi:hypothetical protein